MDNKAYPYTDENVEQKGYCGAGLGDVHQYLALSVPQVEGCTLNGAQPGSGNAPRGPAGWVMTPEFEATW